MSLSKPKSWRTDTFMSGRPATSCCSAAAVIGPPWSRGSDRDPFSVGWAAWIRQKFSRKPARCERCRRQKENATFPAGCALDARGSTGQPRRQPALAGRREANHPRSRFAHRPAAREDVRKDRRAKRTAEMVAALAPIKAAAAERPPPPARKRSDVEAALGEE